MDTDDAVMLQISCSTSFAKKSLAIFRVHPMFMRNLDGNRTPQLGVARFPD
ncbi:MAG: hypothetical protein AAFN70_00475 [Planctomycetota bacterium]